MKLKSMLVFLMASASATFGASTLNLRNFASASVGVPIVDAGGAAINQATLFANGGYFNVTMNWATATALDIRTAFVSIDNSPLTGGTRSGLFTGQTFNGVLPAGFAGKAAYTVVGDNADFALSTKFAVFNAGAVFTAPDGVGNSAQTLDSSLPSSVVFGTVRTVTGQPSGVTNPAYANGVQLVVPEPSAALLGALGVLGLLRRRRI